MSRNSMILPPKKNPKKSEKKHHLSATLAVDPRARSAPRHVETVHTAAAGEEGELVFLVKVYASLETPGSELMTVSCVSKATGAEAELRFDEKFPVSINFRKQTDLERITYAKSQIERAGGFEFLRGLFRTSFPKLEW